MEGRSPRPRAKIFMIAPRQFQFPRLTDDNPFVGVCEAVLE